MSSTKFVRSRLPTRYPTFLAPTMSRILSCVAHHLERKPGPYVPVLFCVRKPTHRTTRLHALSFLRIIVAACRRSRVVPNTILANRLVRAVIPYLTKPILPRLETKGVEGAGTGGSSKRKGKKRARGYEGDEALKTSPAVLFDSPHEERTMMLSVEGRSPLFHLVSCIGAELSLALRLLLLDAGISSEVYSVASRLLLSLFLHLSRLPPSVVSKDLTFHDELSSRLQIACIEFASTKPVVSGRTLPLLMNLMDQKVTRRRRPLVA